MSPTVHTYMDEICLTFSVSISRSEPVMLDHIIREVPEVKTLDYMDLLMLFGKMKEC